MNSDKENKLIGSLLKSANVFKLKCEQCNDVSVQISEKEKPDLVCLDCGGTCKVL